jgi:hypothetical protein
VFATSAFPISLIGTDLAFVHIFKNNVPQSTADARPLFDVFYLTPLSDRAMLQFSIEYQWNQFTGGYIGALKTKGCVGLYHNGKRTLPLLYAGAAPTWLSIRRERMITYESSPWSTFSEPEKIFKDGFAMDACAGFRHILRQRRFFSFGYSVEYNFLLPFFNITDIFIDEAVGLNCIKAGFSFTFRTNRDD